MAESPKQTAPDSKTPLAIVFDQLACPACLGELRMDGARLACLGCQRFFPIIDGIPVLIAERSESAPA